MVKTLTRKEITNSIVKSTELSYPKATQFLEYVLETMVEALAGQGVLKIASFGSFRVHQKLKRMGRNPKTGQKAMITPRRVVSFKSSAHLRRKIQSRKAS